MNSILPNIFPLHIVFIGLFGLISVIIANLDNKEQIYSASIAYLILSVLILIISLGYMIMKYYNHISYTITITYTLLLASIFSIISIVFSILTLEEIKNNNEDKYYKFYMNQIIFGFLSFVCIVYGLLNNYECKLSNSPNQNQTNPTTNQTTTK